MSAGVAKETKMKILLVLKDEVTKCNYELRKDKKHKNQSKLLHYKNTCLERRAGGSKSFVIME
jgi:hypothetical protein